MARGTHEKKVKRWIQQNYGAMSRIARELNLSPQHIHCVAFNRRVSKDQTVEKRLLALGCPIAQKVA